MTTCYICAKLIGTRPSYIVATRIFDGANEVEGTATIHRACGKLNK